MTSVYFVIVSSNDNLIYETNCINMEFDKPDERMNLQQVTAYASMDVIMEKSLSSNQMYLGIVESSNGWLVYAFLTPSNHRFILLNTQLNEESIRSLFIEIFDGFLKVTLNPFYQFNEPITNKEFDIRVKNCLKRFVLK
ncbi:Trafficking protein particle complex subunit 2 [Intoshia linei]|uniref:Trafficking protein particle complex subunit 2 n=1 Tax=Intoshia linei TaxID=1819745 RepID=A0A177AX76_9BILA|nr:Trafficking protein particle complex subunit 2 [Intoshia linei]